MATDSLQPISGVAAARALAWRELVRVVRRPSQIYATLGTAALFWLLLGSGFAASFRPPEAVGDASYSAFLVPGVVTMVVMFGTIFAAIGLIQDRHEGTLQGVLASAAPRWSVVASKVAGGVVFGVGQAALMLLAAPLVGIDAGPIGYLGALAAAALTAVGVVSMGLALAWRVDSISGFHGLMNLVLVPMWLLSGALFPLEGAHGWLALVMRINPLGWCTRAMGSSLGVSPMGVGDWVGAVAFACAMFALAVWSVSRR
jgi:ABC-2 type transport system permease protein